MSESSQSRSRPRLGRGLSSLIINSNAAPPDETYVHDASGETPSPGRPAHTPLHADHPGSHRIHEIPVDQIASNPYQPRRDFAEDELATLADSIAQQGILQPLVVVKRDAAQAGDMPYVLVAGERRLRAARRIGHAAVPCVIREATPRQMLEWALIENIQRSDLNPIERAEAYRGYIDRFHLTQADAAERLGQPRATVANYLRLLELGGGVREMILDGRLSFGHAKVLAGLIGDPARQLVLARQVVEQSLSVRRLEELVSGDKPESPGPKATRHVPAKAPHIRDLESQLSQTIGTRVTIHPGRAKNTGRLVIDYYSLDDFDRITNVLGATLES